MWTFWLNVLNANSSFETTSFYDVILLICHQCGPLWMSKFCTITLFPYSAKVYDVYEKILINKQKFFILRYSHVMKLGHRKKAKWRKLKFRTKLIYIMGIQNLKADSD